jgi:hypothetical protein
MVPMTQHPARSQAVEVLELRVREALPLKPVPVEYETSPVQRAGLMAAGRVRQAEDSKLAQLERELVMERLRVKELREQLEAAMEGRQPQALVGMLEGASAEAKCMELQAELREVRQAMAAVKLFADQLGEDYECTGHHEVCDWVEKTVLPGLKAALEGRVG